MFYMGANSSAEGFFRALYKVATTTAVCVHINSSRHYIAAFGIDNFSTYDV